MTYFRSEMIELMRSDHYIINDDIRLGEATTLLYAPQYRLNGSACCLAGGNAASERESAHVDLTNDHLSAYALYPGSTYRSNTYSQSI